MNTKKKKTKNKKDSEKGFNYYNVYRFTLSKPIYAGGLNEEDVRIAVASRLSQPIENIPKGILIGQYNIHNPKDNKMITLDFRNFMRHRKLFVKTFYIDKYKNELEVEVSKVRDRISQARYLIDLLYSEDFKLIDILQNLEVEYNKIVKLTEGTFTNLSNQDKLVIETYISRISRNYNTGFYVAPELAYGVKNYTEYKELFEQARIQLSNRLIKNRIENCMYDENFTLQERLDAYNNNESNYYCRVA